MLAPFFFFQIQPTELVGTGRRICIIKYLAYTGLMAKSLQSAPLTRTGHPRLRLEHGSRA